MFFLVSVLFLKARGGTLAMNSLASHECLFFFACDITLPVCLIFARGFLFPIIHLCPCWGYVRLHLL